MTRPALGGELVHGCPRTCAVPSGDTPALERLPGSTLMGSHRHCTWVATGDFNEDGRVDIVAARNGSGQPVTLFGP